MTRGSFYANGARTLLPAWWRWRNAIGQHVDHSTIKLEHHVEENRELRRLATAPLTRLQRALEARDQVHRALNQPQHGDTAELMLANLDIALVMLMAGVDATARVAHRALDLSQKGIYSAGWQQLQWLDQVRTVDADLAATFDLETTWSGSVVLVLSRLRNCVHGAAAALLGIKSQLLGRVETVVEFPDLDTEALAGYVDKLVGTERAAQGLTREPTSGERYATLPRTRAPRASQTSSVLRLGSVMRRQLRPGPVLGVAEQRVDRGAQLPARCGEVRKGTPLSRVVAGVAAADSCRARPVWTGPGAQGEQRLTAALHELLESARDRILLVSYAAYTLPEIAADLEAAVARCCRVDVAFETTEDSAGAYNGPHNQPFGTTADITRWHWPADHRTGGAVLHAKLLVIDGERAFVGSANLTSRALAHNLEVGVLLVDPAVAADLEDHVRGLMLTATVLER